MVKLKRLSRKNNARVNMDEKSIMDVKISALTDSLRDEMISVGDAIVANVKTPASDEDPKEDSSTITSDSCKRSATAGSVGEFLAKRRK